MSAFFFLGTIQNWRSNLAKEKFSQAKSIEYLFFMNSQFTPLPLFHFTDVTRYGIDIKYNHKLKHSFN